MEKFADAFGNMQLASQVVRIDLLTVEPAPSETAAPAKPGEALRMQRQGQLVMPLEGFVRAYASMGQMMQRLVQAGVLKVENTAAAAEGIAATAVTTPAGQASAAVVAAAPVPSAGQAEQKKQKAGAVLPARNGRKG